MRHWTIEAQWGIDMLSNRIENMAQWVNPNDAITLQQFNDSVSPVTITNTIVYTCERNGTATWPYAWGNWAANNFWWYIPFDWTIVTVSLADEWGSPSWAWFALDVNWVQQFTFTQSGNFTTANPNISVSEWDYVTFNCTSSGTWWSNRVASIVFQSQDNLTWLRWEQWDPWLNAWTTFSWTSLPPASDFPDGTIFRISDWTKTWPDWDEYRTDWVATRTFLSNVLWPAWSWTQIDYVRLWLGNSNTVNSLVELPISVFNTTADVISNPWLFTLTPTWIQVTQGWDYEVSSSLFFSSTAQRPNIWVRFSVNWTSQWIQLAWDYIRSQSWHNEASTSWTDLFTLNSWDIIWINTIRLAAAGTVNLDGSLSNIYIKKVW